MTVVSSDNTMDINTFIKKVPKVELHRHLSGAVRSPEMFRIASEHGLEVEGATIEEFNALTSIHGQEKGFTTFLQKFKPRARFYTNTNIIPDIVKSAVKDAADDNIIYLELRFSSSHFSRHMKFDPVAITEQIISNALAEAEQHNMYIEFLMTLTRDIPYEENRQLLDIALSSSLSGYFSGIDIAGNEADIPLDTIKPLVKRAVLSEKGVSIHAGEAGPAHNVREAIDAGSDRIGHGVKSFCVPELVNYAIAQGITFEVCPTSNLQTATIQNVSELNIKKLLDQGVNITINTDDPGISGTTLTNELIIAAETFTLDETDIITLLTNAVNGAFIPETKKTALNSKISSL